MYSITFKKSCYIVKVVTKLSDKQKQMLKVYFSNELIQSNYNKKVKIHL